MINDILQNKGIFSYFALTGDHIALSLSLISEYSLADMLYMISSFGDLGEFFLSCIGSPWSYLLKLERNIDSRSCPQIDLVAFIMSSGGGAVNEICPVLYGIGIERNAACNAWRDMCSLGDPYISSPNIECPIWAKCTRSW